MSFVYRQTISDELHACIESRRGLLSVQEFTTNALAAVLAQPSVDELQRQIADLRTQIAQLATTPAPSLYPRAAPPTIERLTF